MSTGSMCFQDWLLACVNNVETALEKALPGANEVPLELHEAMRYATLGGAKEFVPRWFMRQEGLPCNRALR